MCWLGIFQTNFKLVSITHQIWNWITNQSGTEIEINTIRWRFDGKGKPAKKTETTWWRRLLTLQKLLIFCSGKRKVFLTVFHIINRRKKLLSYRSCSSFLEYAYNYFNKQIAWRQYENENKANVGKCDEEKYEKLYYNLMSFQCSLNKEFPLKDLVLGMCMCRFFFVVAIENFNINSLDPGKK